MKKILTTALAVLIAFGTLPACGKQELSEEEKAAAKTAEEMQQNDYRGGVIRTLALKDSVLDVMDSMKQNNETLRTDNPNSFWSMDGYQDFVINFMNADIIEDTKWFNEEETDWEEALENIASYDNTFTQYDKKEEEYILYDDVKITRNEKDDYSISTQLDFKYDGVKYDSLYNYRLLYDCDKDWLKAYAETNLSADIPPVTVELYEYARLDENTFAVQTKNERLLVVFEPAAEDTLLRDRTLKEFYYSKLTSEGERTTFNPYVHKEEIGEDGVYREENIEMNNIMGSFPFVNEKGEIATLYSKNNSIFKNENIAESVNGEWVFEDKSLQQAMVYKDGALVVITYNKLTEAYERFIYTLDGVPDSVVDELQNMIEIKNLVGIHKNETTIKPDSYESGEVTDSNSNDFSSSSSENDESSEAVPYTPEGATPSENEPEGVLGTQFGSTDGSDYVTTTTTTAPAPEPEPAPAPAESQPTETQMTENSVPEETVTEAVTTTAAESPVSRAE